MGVLVSTGSCPHCGSGHNTPCFAEYTDGYKCYSCGVSKSYNQEQQAFLPKATIVEKSRLGLPEHIRHPSMFPVQLKKWLYQYYLSDDMIRKANILATENSLIFLSHEDGKVKFYQQRFFPHKIIKGVGARVPMKFRNGHKTIVLTEDYISALRVSECNVDSWCLFGTSIGYHEVQSLLDSYNYIILWLDGDDAGIHAREKISNTIKNRLQYLKRRFPYKYMEEVELKIIETENDPKEYSPTEMERIIYG